MLTRVLFKRNKIKFYHKGSKDIMSFEQKITKEHLNEKGYCLQV